MEKNEILKLTVPKLREEALKLGTVSGVHGMNKVQLVEVLFQHFGIAMEEKAKRQFDPAIKSKIRALRVKKEAANKDKDKKQVEIMRRKIHQLKRLTRA